MRTRIYSRLQVGEAHRYPTCLASVFQHSCYQTYSPKTRLEKQAAMLTVKDSPFKPAK
ncbi:MAG: hypothetical protein HC862_17990 [Scytonema sp. RU_4_4]|nr:hypothetical protein [Scytonema sp. RU_4_4]NJR72697.1 hypothetical protein [Scytonema sp. CRU_2_7]